MLILGFDPSISALPRLSAQSSCTADREPNDTPAAEQQLQGAFCLDADLPENDQDLVLWTVSDGDALTRWSVALTGVPGTVTSLRVFPVTDDTTSPMTVGSQLVQVDAQPESRGQVVGPSLMLSPGLYVVGISRSGTLAGTPPVSTGYHVDVRTGDPAPNSGDAEPNNDATTATAVSGAFALIGDLQGSEDWYAWSLNQANAAKGWELHAEGPAGDVISLEIDDGAGNRLASATADTFGHVDFFDLVFAPGIYVLHVGSNAEHPRPYILETRTGKRPTTDLEPNDSVAGASSLDSNHPIATGRISREGDIDYYRLTVSEELAATQLDLKIISRNEIQRRVCLRAEDDSEIQCRDATTGAALSNLLLLPGTYYIAVSGAASIAAQYVLRIDPTAAPVADFETEPNDQIALAVPFQPGVPMRGRFNSHEEDYYRLTVSGEPQLWQVAIDGAKIDRLAVIDASGGSLADGEITNEGAHSQLSDLFLTPGDHWFRVAGTDGDYRLTAVPTGPPDPDGEREPNASLVASEPLRIGVARNGRLVEANDTDMYRFSLAATEHLNISVKPPADGSVSYSLGWGTTSIARVSSSESGAAAEFDGLLLPGDYLIQLSAIRTSTDPYTIEIRREDPLTLPADQEPNDSLEQARALPPTLSVSGTGGEHGDDDWFLLPDLGRVTGVTVTLESGSGSLFISDGTTDLPLTTESDAKSWSGRLPAGTPLALRVSVAGPYQASVAFVDGPVPRPAATNTLKLALTTGVTAIAAYWTEGQRVDAILAISNNGLLPQSAELDAVTSHYGWSVELAKSGVTVLPGSTTTVAVTIHIAADAWADFPQRITVRAQTNGGAAQTAFIELTPGRDAPPVNPEPSWTIPSALRGGLDVSSIALGGEVVGSVDAKAEAALHDGITPDNGGFRLSTATLPLELTVDLAGDDAAPVAGIILNPQGDQSIADHARRFEFLISEDGEDFQRVLTGELSPLPIEQSFVLSKPVAATFARLRLISSYGVASSTAISLGEWKVIAAPGFTPTKTPLDISDLALGGHIVRIDPQPAYDSTIAQSLLTPDRDRLTIPVSAGDTPSWVIGFEEDRAARVTSLEWVDPDSSTPDTRFHRVAIDVSTESPLGPWAAAGTWKLTRAGDGTVRPFTLDQPVWARYIRFTGDGPGDSTSDWEYPAQIRVIEAMTDQTYQSIVGQWGYGSAAGIYETLEPPIITSPANVMDNDNTPQQATSLPANETKSGRVQIGNDVDWFAVKAPADQNVLTFRVSGEPAADATVHVVTVDGRDVPVHLVPSDDPHIALYEASVEPGKNCYARVEQPPHSIMFAFDTSISLTNYEPFIQQAMKSFAADITTGEEFVNLMPFDEQALLDKWADQPYLVQTALNSYTDVSLSSSAEATILNASDDLAGRDGAKAILILTDAETSSYDAQTEMWNRLEAVDPRIFAVHIGAGSDPRGERHFMQDWAAAGEGFYQYAQTQGEIDRAFDRAATWLRRPAEYTISFETSFAEGTPEPATATPSPTATSEPTVLPSPPPTLKATVAAVEPTPAQAGTGTLRVTGGTSDTAGRPAAISAEIAVEIILDTSGSMLQELEPGRSRIDVAKSVLTDLVTTQLPPGAPVALRIFGSEPDSCETRLAAPLGLLVPESMASTIQNLQVVNLVKTPIGDALRQVQNDLADVSGPKIVVLVTDGEETCGGDASEAISELASAGFDVQVNIVGFALDDDELKSTFKTWARLGNGSYFDATNASELDDAVTRALEAPYQVYDEAGDVVASGTVDGKALKLAAGTYTVVVLTDPVARFDEVIIETGKKTTVDVSS